MANLVADPHEFGEFFIVCSDRVSRVIEWPVPAFNGTRKRRALFLRTRANTDNEIRWRAAGWQKFVDRLASQGSNIDPHFTHHSDSVFVNVPGRIRSC